MALFSNKDGVLQEIGEVPFKYEKGIQGLTEKNLKVLFGLEYVRSEFELDGLRIDTLAFDRENNSFVIIEYKRDKNISVIDQGYAYLGLMLNNKAEFILEFNEKKKENLKREDVDWSQSKVIFISPSFTTYQQKAVQFKDLAFELWEVTQYQNGVVLYEQIKPAERTESIKTISGSNELVQKVSREIKVYTEDDHLKNASEENRELYEKLKEKIMELGDNISIKPTKLYLAFKAKSNFVDVEIQKKRLKIFLNLQSGELDDPRKIAKDVSNIGHWGNGDYEIHFSDANQLNYILDLVQQSYQKNR